MEKTNVFENKITQKNRFHNKMGNYIKTEEKEKTTDSNYTCSLL